MKRKRTGASLIVVIIVIMFISTVSMTMLSMIAGNYRARVMESKTVENLYGSDSGLNIAYNIIGKTIDAGNQYGDLKVKEMKKLTKDSSPDGATSSPSTIYINLKKDIDYWENYNSNPKNKHNQKPQNEINDYIASDNKILDTVINEEFKSSFKSFILESNVTTDSGVSEIKDSIINKRYVNQIKNLDNKVSSYDIAEVQFLSTNNPPPTLSINDTDGIKYNQWNKRSISNKTGTVSFDVYDNQRYTIKVQSQFQSKQGNTNVAGTTKTVQATYTLSVPNYRDVYFTQSFGDSKYAALDDQALTIYGNMDVMNLNKLNINGDIFVQGHEPNINNIVYDKYKGGITLNNINTFNFNNDVITQETFNIGENVGSDNNQALINGNLYSRNMYIGNIDGTEASNTQSNVHIGDLVVDNDLTLNAKNAKIDINNFYGINEKTVSDNSDINREKKSSSIIVNGNDKSNVTINNNAYIMGVAYIDTKDELGKSKPYKTGESLAFKGNYIAYSVPDPNKTKEVFSYHNPLYLFDPNKNDTESEIDQLRKHFENYWDGKLTDDNTGGISLPSNTKAIGAIMYKDSTGKIQVKNDAANLIDPIIDEKGVIIPKRGDYARKVYNMGYPQRDTDYTALASDKQTYLQNLYTSPTNAQYTLDTMMNLPEDIDETNNYGNDNSSYSAVDEANNVTEKSIFTKKDILISGDNASGDVKLSNDYIYIDASKNKEIDAVIATEGNVTIDGDVNFKGNIIAKGNLTVEGKTNFSQSTSISYNADIVKKVQFEHIELFEKVFGGRIDDEEDSWQSNEEELNPNYDLKKFLNISLWKVVK